MATTHHAVSPESILHLVPVEQKPKKDFCEAHGLRVAYFNMYRCTSSQTGVGGSFLYKLGEFPIQYILDMY